VIAADCGATGGFDAAMTTLIGRTADRVFRGLLSPGAAD